jgi:hypothetical protein
MPQRTDDENIFFETLDWICDKLEKHDIPYMITGGSAVGFWGHIRTTMDIDILIQIKTKNLDLFLESIKGEAYTDLDRAGSLLKTSRMFNVIYNKTCFKVDLIPLDHTPYEIEKFNSRVKIRVGERDLFVIRPEDLIISKLLWGKSAGGSERQIKDCESIFKLNKENIDLAYMEKWVAELKLESEFNEIRK